MPLWDVATCREASHLLLLLPLLWPEAGGRGEPEEVAVADALEEEGRGC